MIGSNFTERCAISSEFLSRWLVFESVPSKKEGRDVVTCVIDRWEGLKVVDSSNKKIELNEINTSYCRISEYLNQKIDSIVAGKLLLNDQEMIYFFGNLVRLNAKIQEQNNQPLYWLACRLLSPLGKFDAEPIKFERLEPLVTKVNQNLKSLKCVRKYALLWQRIVSKNREEKKQVELKQRKSALTNAVSVEQLIAQQEKKIVATFTNEELKQRFENIRVLGGGGEGRVWKVKDKSISQYKALKICNGQLTELYRKVAAVISSIVSKGLSIHLTNIEELYEVISKKHYDWEGTGSNFVQAPSLEQPLYKRRVYLLELLQGDIGQLYQEGNTTTTEWIAYQVQAASVQALLHNRFSTSVVDDKPRNIFYKELRPEDTFKGEKLIEYDYWKYRIGEVEFYIPRLKYLIKLGDYDSWQISDPIHVEKAVTASKALEALTLRLKNYDCIVKTAQDAAALFHKPTNPKAKILELS